jgi:hypothetical protein
LTRRSGATRFDGRDDLILIDVSLQEAGDDEQSENR